MELHTPDGRKLNCNFLNKFDFAIAGTITDNTTGYTKTRTEEDAKIMNDSTEKKAAIEIIRRVKNPNDRQAMLQYVHRMRGEADNFRNEGNAEMKTYTSVNNRNITGTDKTIKTGKRKFNIMAQRQIRGFKADRH